MRENLRKSITKICVLLTVTNMCWDLTPACASETHFARISNDHAKMRNAFNRLFVQADKPYQFLGEPTVALLDMPGKDQSFDYYLLAIPFNVPMIKKNLPFHYKYVRLDGDLHVLATKPIPGTTANYCRLKVLSIYPTNSAINATMESTHTLEETIQPEWNGASAGNIHNLNSDVLSYQLQMPTMAGIAAPYCDDGSVNNDKYVQLRWTIYPAKKQQIMIGNRLGLALIAVEKHTGTTPDERRIWFNGALSYSLTLGPPLSTSNYQETWELPISGAVSLDQLFAEHALDFPSDDLELTLKKRFQKPDKDTKFSVAKITSDRATMLEANSGTVQEITKEGLSNLPNFSRQWETLDLAGNIWNLVTAEGVNDSLTCRATLFAPSSPDKVWQKMTVRLKDSKGKLADKTVTLGCQSHRQDKSVQQQISIFEGSTILGDEALNAYDTWEPAI